MNIKSMRPGFSFIEMMIVLAIMGILITTLGPNLYRYLGKSRTQKTEAHKKIIEGGIKEYYSDIGHFPSKIEDLITKPEGASGWDGPYGVAEGKDDLPKDAWDQEFNYKLNPPRSKPPYELYSDGDPSKEDAERI